MFLCPGSQMKYFHVPGKMLMFLTDNHTNSAGMYSMVIEESMDSVWVFPAFTS